MKYHKGLACCNNGNDAPTAVDTNSLEPPLFLATLCGGWGGAVQCERRVGCRVGIPLLMRLMEASERIEVMTARFSPRVGFDC